MVTSAKMKARSKKLLDEQQQLMENFVNIFSTSRNPHYIKQALNKLLAHDIKIQQCMNQLIEHQEICRQIEQVYAIIRTIIYLSHIAKKRKKCSFDPLFRL